MARTIQIPLRYVHADEMMSACLVVLSCGFHGHDWSGDAHWNGLLHWLSDPSMATASRQIFIQSMELLTLSLSAQRYLISR